MKPRLFLILAILIIPAASSANDKDVGNLQFIDYDLGCVRFLEKPTILSPSQMNIVIYRTCDFSFPVNSFFGSNPKMMSVSESYRIDCASKTSVYLSSKSFRQQFWNEEIDLYKSKDMTFITFSDREKNIFERACKIGF